MGSVTITRAGVVRNAPGSKRSAKLTVPTTLDRLSMVAFHLADTFLQDNRIVMALLRTANGSGMAAQCVTQ
ncbi:MAG: hypothetical protein R3C14_11505 [Caldilineaceae bacterium]